MRSLTPRGRKGLNGIIYPSVRRARRTCIVALRPHTWQNPSRLATLIDSSGPEIRSHDPADLRVTNPTAAAGIRSPAPGAGSRRAYG
jgi:hypothetical protein